MLVYTYENNRCRFAVQQVSRGVHSRIHESMSQHFRWHCETGLGSFLRSCMGIQRWQGRHRCFAPQVYQFIYGARSVSWYQYNNGQCCDSTTADLFHRFIQYSTTYTYLHWPHLPSAASGKQEWAYSTICRAGSEDWQQRVSQMKLGLRGTSRLESRYCICWRSSWALEYL